MAEVKWINDVAVPSGPAVRQEMELAICPAASWCGVGLCPGAG